jgi:CBS domain-containing protein
MKQREPITKIMTESVITVGLNNSLTDAAQIFKKNHIRHIPVVSESKLVGMLSLTDMKRLSFFDVYTNAGMDEDDETSTNLYEMLTIEQVMANNPNTVSKSTTIKEVAEIFSTHEFHALPVVQEGELIGIVTTTDLIKFLLNQY